MSDTYDELAKLLGLERPHGTGLIAAAKAEIERLQMELRALRQDDGAVIAQLQNEIEQLHQRLGELRAEITHNERTIERLRRINDT